MGDRTLVAGDALALENQPELAIAGNKTPNGDTPDTAEVLRFDLA